jgi:hypothetical protein
LILHVGGVKKALKKKTIVPVNAVKKWQRPNGHFVKASWNKGSKKVGKAKRWH